MSEGMISDRRVRMRFMDKVKDAATLILALAGIASWIKSTLVGAVRYPMKIEMQLQNIDDAQKKFGTELQPMVVRHERQIAEIRTQMNTQYAAILNAIDNLHRDVREYRGGRERG